jgi:hypothetical protein
VKKKRMGTPRNEVSSFRKAGDHPAGRAIPSAGAPDAGKARRLARHFLQMVRPLSDRRAEALEDRSPRPDRVWNRIPDDVPGQIVQLALDEPKPSPRELATRFPDSKSYFGFREAPGAAPIHSTLFGSPREMPMEHVLEAPHRSNQLSSNSATRPERPQESSRPMP